jgi:hypothetical protein
MAIFDEPWLKRFTMHHNKVHSLTTINTTFLAN